MSKTIKVLVTAWALVVVSVLGFNKYQERNQMPDVWGMREVAGLDMYPGESRGLYGVCENGFVVAVSFDQDKDGRFDLVAYFLVREHERSKNMEELRPFIIQQNNEKEDQSIDGDIFLLDLNLDGKIDKKLTFPHDDLGRGPCDAAARVSGAKHTTKPGIKM